MSADIVLWLAQDGITNGAIYALLALALLVVFSVTRVIFVPQGEFISYDSRAEFFTVHNTPTGESKPGGGRIKAVIQPRSESKEK